MIGFFTQFFMLFVDRLCLARYSLVAHNAAVNAGMMAWTFVLAIQTLCQMSEVFVAQYNGAGQQERMATPVWTMLWVAFASSFVLLPLARYGGPYFFDPELPGYQMKQVYFFWMMLGAPLSGILGALTAFFIGRGDTRVITICALLGNATNIILDPLFIFGFADWIPSMGVRGAAIATQLGIAIQVLALGALFLRPVYWERYGVQNWGFRFERLWAYLPVVLPSAFMALVEIGGWSLYYDLMARVSETHILVAGICQNVIILLLFFGLGLEKGVAVLAGNLIGARNTRNLHGLLWRASVLATAFALTGALLFALYPEPLLWLFLSQAEQAGTLANMGSAETIRAMTYSCVLIAFLFVGLDQLKLIVGGVLIAAGDTVILMWTNAAAIWFFLLIPTYYFINLRGGSVELSIFIWSACAAVQAVLLWMRYRSGAWTKRDLVSM
jgi:MATE family multidrug resistance protein